MGPTNRRGRGRVWRALTDDGLLREAVFKGFRDDLALRKVKAPRLVPSVTGRRKLGVPRENILQLLPDAVVPSKDDLSRYWSRVWKKALPHLGHRPLKLVRHVHGTTFYHKGPLPNKIPNDVHRLRIKKREGGEAKALLRARYILLFDRDPPKALGPDLLRRSVAQRMNQPNIVIPPHARRATTSMLLARLLEIWKPTFDTPPHSASASRTS